MKKTNKILTRALVILLALVLITSSVVSSTFAKYVVRKEATTTVQLQKFGLTVTLTPLESLKDDSKVENIGDSIKYTLNNVTLVPGDDQTYKNAIIASVTGNATVNCKVKVKVDVTVDDAPFTINSTNFTNLSNTGVYNPITFYVGGTSVNNTVYTPITGTADKKIENDVETKINTALAKNGFSAEGDGFITKSFDIVQGQTTVAVNETDLGIGFAWKNPPESNETNCLDEISTWISNNPYAKFTITYTISVEQAT